MVEFSFYLSREDTDRIFALKDDDETGNDYAKRLLIRELHRLHPATVEYDENGIIKKERAHA